MKSFCLALTVVATLVAAPAAPAIEPYNYILWPLSDDPEEPEGPYGGWGTFTAEGQYWADDGPLNGMGMMLEVWNWTQGAEIDYPIYQHVVYTGSGGAWEHEFDLQSCIPTQDIMDGDVLEVRVYTYGSQTPYIAPFWSEPGYFKVFLE